MSSQNREVAFQNLFNYVATKCKSQLGQDMFVLLRSNFKRNGYFVEFGGTNGVELSNTHILEKEFGWRGIIAEPAIIWHKELVRNRGCHIEIDCVWDKSGEILTFNETNFAVLSTIDKFSSHDELHKESRKIGKKYDVKTISLEDMLIKYLAPKTIDYLSIDTEGSEYQILSNFNFDKYEFKFITCEHNYTADREKIYSLLLSKGYLRVEEGKSQFDDWYVKENLKRSVLLYL